MNLWLVMLLLVHGRLCFAESSDYVNAAVTAVQAVANGKVPSVSSNEIFGRCEISGRGDVAMNSPCNGVEIILLKNDAELTRMNADANGEFRFSRLTSGTYDIKIESPKYKLAHPIKLTTGRTYSVLL